MNGTVSIAVVHVFDKLRLYSRCPERFFRYYDFQEEARVQEVENVRYLTYLI